MIVAQNSKPSLPIFADLMKETDAKLNADAVKRSAYYKTRNGIALESDVFQALSFKVFWC